MVVDNEYVNVEAGCGVVYDSNPQKELKETMIKAKVYWRLHHDISN